MVPMSSEQADFTVHDCRCCTNSSSFFFGLMSVAYGVKRLFSCEHRNAGKVDCTL